MAHLYAVTVQIDVTPAGGDVDLFSFVPADDRPITLRGWSISQFTELGEVQEEGIALAVRRFGATVTPGTLGSVVTAQAPPEEPGDPVWSFVARTNDTTIATTSGTNFLYDLLGWNVRNSPYERWYPEKKGFCLKARQGEAIILRNETIVVDSISLCLTAWIEEE